MIRCIGCWALIILLMLMSGCAPASFELAEPHYADQYHVRDAAARRTRGCWFLRFNELMISDLNDAIAAGKAGDAAGMRASAALTLRAADSLGQSAAESEIDRLPEKARYDLAGKAGCAPSADALKEAYRNRSRQALETLLHEVETLPTDRVVQRLTEIRNGIEPGMDDQGRFWRQLVLVWGAVPAWLGISQVELTREQERPRLEKKIFERVLLWTPPNGAEKTPLQEFAPTIVMEDTPDRNYPPSCDRFGEVYLTGEPADIHVNINTSWPVVYTYRAEAKINGRRYAQLAYSWWFPERPAMVEDDPAAGRIDGDTFRITLDRNGRPGVFEVVQSCGCGHLVYVARHVEEQARRQFGGVMEGKRLAVEKQVAGKRDLIVSGVIDVPEQGAHPMVYILAGYHEVSGVDCAVGLQQPDAVVSERHGYDLRPYELLDRLPLGDGVASMFGGDGLVHNAGRKEGYLLAPTGMLSAGQPRKRGTQKIRWDDFSLDDPHLLEQALRLPDGF